MCMYILTIIINYTVVFKMYVETLYIIIKLLNVQTITLYMY